MLVLNKVSGLKSKTYYEVPYGVDLYDSGYSKIKIDIYDTDKQLLQRDIPIIILNIAKVSGVFHTGNKLILIPINNRSLKLISYINPPKKIFKLSRSYRPKLPKNSIRTYTTYRFILNNKECFINFATYISESYNLVIVYIRYIKSLDKKKVFWSFGDTIKDYVNISFLYNLLLGSPIPIDINTKVYFINTFGRCNCYKFSINQDVIRYLTKMKALGNSLC